MEYYNILKSNIILMIKDDLTIGRNDNNLQQFTNEEIDKFIKDNNENIENVISLIITEYNNDDELYLLKNPSKEWIREYLYLFIDTAFYK